MLLRLIRWFLGKLILALEALLPPRRLVRSEPEQQRIDRETRSMSLYQFEACPFCVKTRRAAQRLGLTIELRDAKRGTDHARNLVAGGGELQVPCLRIDEEGGKTRWMYESSDIIAYLENRFGPAA